MSRDLSLHASSLNTPSPKDAQVVGGYTPTPWGVEYCSVAERHHIEAGAFPYGISICELNGNTNDAANAALIVKAVNSHAPNEAKIAAAVKALEAQEMREAGLNPPWARDIGHDCMWCSDCVQRLKDMCRTTLSSLKEGK